VELGATNQGKVSSERTRFCRDREKTFLGLDPSHRPIFAKSDESRPIDKDRQHVTNTRQLSQIREQLSLSLQVRGQNFTKRLPLSFGHACLANFVFSGSFSPP
jgi:hypothetical protein